MKTDDLIQKLSSDTKPIHKLGTPFIRFLKWLAAALLCVGVGVALMGLREDFMSKLAEPIYLIESIFILLLMLSSGLAAFILSIPNANASAWTKWLPCVPLFLWAGFLVYELSFVYVNQGFSGFVMEYGIGCTRDVLVLAVVPGALLFFMVQKAAPTSLAWVGALILLSVAALGSMGVQFICSNSQPLHIFIWHFLPVILVGAAGIYLGKKILKW